MCAPHRRLGHMRPSYAPLAYTDQPNRAARQVPPTICNMSCAPTVGILGISPFPLFGFWVFQSRKCTLRSVDPPLLSAQRSASVLQQRWAPGNASINDKRFLQEPRKSVSSDASAGAEAVAHATSHITRIPARCGLCPTLGPGGWSRRALSYVQCGSTCGLRTFWWVELCAPHRRSGHMRPSYALLAYTDQPNRAARQVFPHDIRHTLGPRGSNRAYRPSFWFISLVFQSRECTLRSFDPALQSAQRSASVLRARRAAGSASNTAAAVLVNRGKKSKRTLRTRPKLIPRARRISAGHLLCSSALQRLRCSARAAGLAAHRSFCIAARPADCAQFWWV